jgi:GDPmannose 4,6-dehydratase
VTVRRALITGITGQDGSFLAELLLAKGYEVHGLVRRTSSSNTSRIDPLIPDAGDRLRLHIAELSDLSALVHVLRLTEPHEIYHLAAQSHVGHSFTLPIYTGEVILLGTIRLLEAIRVSGQQPRFYQASSSEQFGLVAEEPQCERTPFHPRSPYGCAKVGAHTAVINVRESYGLHASCGILFNHESERRGVEFVTRKITATLARIACGMETTLELGNLEAARDWGFAGDYVDAMWRMLQQETPDDYVVATGVMHRVTDVLEVAGAHLGVDWRAVVRENPALRRPAEVDRLRGDATKARRVLGWEPTLAFDALIRRMCDADLVLARSQRH